MSNRTFDGELTDLTFCSIKNLSHIYNESKGIYKQDKRSIIDDARARPAII
jgi:hypothetical protein